MNLTLIAKIVNEQSLIGPILPTRPRPINIVVQA